MAWAGFEPTIPVFERFKITYVLDSATTGASDMDESVNIRTESSGKNYDAYFHLNSSVHVQRLAVMIN